MVDKLALDSRLEGASVSKASAGVLVQLSDEAFELFDTSAGAGICSLRRRIANAVRIVPGAPLVAVIEPSQASTVLASDSAIGLRLDEGVSASVSGERAEASRLGFVGLAGLAFQVEVKAEQRRYREQRGGGDEESVHCYAPNWSVSS